MPAKSTISKQNTISKHTVVKKPVSNGLNTQNTSFKANEQVVITTSHKINSSTYKNTQNTGSSENKPPPIRGCLKNTKLKITSFPEINLRSNDTTNIPVQNANIVINNESKQISSEIKIFNNHEFIFTHYNDIYVIKDKETGYYNAGKICKDNNKEYKYFNTYSSYNNYKQLISEQVGITTSQLTYELDKGFANNVKGTYVHPLLINYILIHINNNYTIKVSTIMNLINEELHLRNTTLEAKISEMKTSLKILSEQKQSLTTPVNRLIPSYIYILKNNNYFKILFSRIKRVSQMNVIKEFELINADDVKKILNNHIKQLSSIIEHIGNGCYEIYDLEALSEIIESIKNNTFDISKYQENININVLINRYTNKIKSCKNKALQSCFAGKLYEYYYFQHLTSLENNTSKSIHLWNHSSQEFLNKYNETHTDHGIDIINESDKIMYQLKYYSNKVIDLQTVYSFINFINEFKQKYSNTKYNIDLDLNITELTFENDTIITQINPEYNYTFKLIIPNNAILNDNIKSILLENNIEIDYFECETLNNLIAENSEQINIKFSDTIIDYIKFLYDKFNKYLTTEFITECINKHFNLNLSNNSINCHYKPLCLKKYPEYISIQNYSIILEEINNYIFQNWKSSNETLQQEILDKFSYNINLREFARRRRIVMKFHPELENFYYTSVNGVSCTYLTYERVHFIKSLYDKYNYFLTDEFLITELNKEFNEPLKRITDTKLILFKMYPEYEQSQRYENVFPNIKNYVLENWQSSDEDLQKYLLETYNYTGSITFIRNKLKSQHPELRIFKPVSINGSSYDEQTIIYVNFLKSLYDEHNIFLDTEFLIDAFNKQFDNKLDFLTKTPKNKFTRANILYIKKSLFKIYPDYTNSQNHSILMKRIREFIIKNPTLDNKTLITEIQNNFNFKSSNRSFIRDIKHKIFKK